MTALDIINPENQLGGRAAQFQPTDSFDIAGEGLVPNALMAPVGLKDIWEDKQYQEREEKIKQRFGKSSDDFIEKKSPSVLSGGVTMAGSVVAAVHGLRQTRKENDDAFDAVITANRATDPKNWQDIKTQAEMIAEINDLGRAEEAEFSGEYGAVSKAQSTGAALGGQLMAGLSGVITDPINLATIGFGAPASAGILRTMAIEAGLNAGIEAAEIPAHAAWAKRMGREYGAKEALLDVGFAGVGAAGLSGAIKGIGSLGSYALNKLSRDARLTPEQRAAAQYQSRVQHVDESIPFPDLEPGPLNIHTNRANMAEAQDAFNNYREPKFDPFDEAKAPLEAPKYAAPELPPKPRDLIDFIISKGGIWDQDSEIGDIRNFDIRGVNKGNWGQLISKDGKSLDELRELAVEAGYLDDVDWEGGVQITTTRDLIDKIHEHMRGNKTYSSRDAAEVDAYESAVRANSQNDLQQTTARQIYERAKERGLTGMKQKDFEGMAKKYLESDDPEITFDEVIFDFQERQASDLYARSRAAAWGEPKKTVEAGEDIFEKSQTLEEVQAIQADLEKIDMLATQEAKFAALVKDMPDAVDELTGMSYKDILEDLKEDAIVADAVRTCSLK